LGVVHESKRFFQESAGRGTDRPKDITAVAIRRRRWLRRTRVIGVVGAVGVVGVVGFGGFGVTRQTACARCCCGGGGAVALLGLLLNSVCVSFNQKPTYR